MLRGNCQQLRQHACVPQSRPIRSHLQIRGHKVTREPRLWDPLVPQRVLFVLYQLPERANSLRGRLLVRGRLLPDAVACRVSSPRRVCLVSAHLFHINQPKSREHVRAQANSAQPHRHCARLVRLSTVELLDRLDRSRHLRGHLFVVWAEHTADCTRVLVHVCASRVFCRSACHDFSPQSETFSKEIQ